MKTSQRRSQRASAACDFCRRRKLGCDNAKPKCENCQGRAIECTYSHRIAQARPSNARIQKLEEENARLRDQLCSRSPELSGVHSDAQQRDTHLAADTPNPIESTPTLNIISDQTHQAKAQAVSPSCHSAIGQPEGAAFHGPSSGACGGIHIRNNKEPPRITSHDEITKNQLLAETAKQRQLEKVNLRARKLDFCGDDPKIGMDLLSKFWNRQHYMGSIVYRPAFMRDMACKGPYYSDLLLTAMLFAGSMHTVDAAALRNTSRLNSIGHPYRIKFEQALHASGSQVLFKSDITTIQALLVVSDALFSWCNERSLSWHYLGIAISMIIDLGLHIDGPVRRSSKKVSAEDTEIERRVFWATFVSDKVQSIYQGRPTRLREHDNRVPIVFLDEYEELEDFHTRTYCAQPSQLDCPTYSVSTFVQLCKLSIIVDRILCALYAERSATKNADQTWQTAQSLHADLQSWKDGLPECLRVDLNDPTSSNILPHNLTLLALYNSLIILIYRPFLSEGHLTSVSATVAPEAFFNCVTAAIETHQILLVYKQHFCFRTAPYFISYATYVSATIHVRMAAQKSPGSQAHLCLRNCLEILSEQQTWCHAPKRTMKILFGIMKRLGVNVGEFVAIEPTSCQDGHLGQIDISELSQVDPDIMYQEPDVSVMQQPTPDTAVDFSNLEFSDFDIDQIMQSFVFEAPLMAQGDFVPVPQPGFSHYGTGDEALTSRDMMVFDNLFGFDSSTS
ncbi:Nit-4-like protein [Fusarium subglutinans]|uniref:Nit-4-like protein n=1 Tax=Gibberella subglutinans TaxID=42677 RepID=A0A8H5UWC3_GIBSU|nr:Nit-4-like protein [Fusarium subglutinans]KAF5601681.1 Nit-4-like protein [Fusarium subglutinans]